MRLLELPEWEPLQEQAQCLVLAFSGMFDPQGPSVIAPCDPRQLSTHASDLQTSLSQSQIMLDLVGPRLKVGACWLSTRVRSCRSTVEEGKVQIPGTRASICNALVFMYSLGFQGII